MATYTVHIPPAQGEDRLELNEKVLFVSDGISWLAFLFPALWLLGYRLWAAFIAYALVIAAFYTVLDDQIASLCGVVIHLFLALEGDSVRRWSLSQKGYSLVDVVTGPTREECERRFFSRWDGTQVIGEPHTLGRASSFDAGSTSRAEPSSQGRSSTWAPTNQRPEASRHAPAALDPEDEVIGLFPKSEVRT